ncbi:MAG: class I SAM-dependent methyltransferase [Nitrosopumilus sp.]|nr:class I SAM-dependent methyltransferase [Nitrosopumilus sp.]MDH3735754.1 class I SAM-dependent methyltransferase [Nitrosopumilus sp.]MDH3824073.1 class I SAM-dependent methyltransferase [Nitrosopumilus sp.]MDH3833223.1 class I SAM-dependent methyltransferase [Nitrosopumilus sp.]
MVSINPLDVFFWTFRRSEKDVINLYTSLSPVMQIATGGSMLNFGFWSPKHTDPISAQNNLSMIFGNLAELSSAKYAVDVGSGLSAPSKLWRDAFPNLSLYCVNINFKQLVFSGNQKNIEFINSTSTKLPFSNNSVDRVLALESAQHFKPLSDFISESKRILKKSGLLVMAIPLVAGESSIGKLGLLKFTWSSEHYSLDYLKNLLLSSGFSICDEKLIGSNVYDPLADYYVKNRTHLRELILKNYPQYVEKILFKSLQKMKKASEAKIIDYALIKCRL